MTPKGRATVQNRTTPGRARRTAVWDEPAGRPRRVRSGEYHSTPCRCTIPWTLQSRRTFCGLAGGRAYGPS